MDLSFFLAHLEKTSRSFYLGIRQLEGQIQLRICLAYLLCRILDTFEDATLLDPKIRLKQLEWVEGLLKNLAEGQDDILQSSLKDWNSNLQLKDEGFWEPYSEIAPYDLDLLKNGAAVFSGINQLPTDFQINFGRSLLPMAQGMKREIAERQIEKELKPRSIQDFKKYCYWVAGTVGEFLTNDFYLEGAFGPAFNLEAGLQQGRQFGEALQIVNITKDFYKDWSEGRCFWPETALPRDNQSPAPEGVELVETFSKLQNLFESNLPAAQAFIGQLRPQAGRIRFFCQFPLKMAQATMNLGKKDEGWLARKSDFKLSRLETARIVASCL